MFLGIVKLYVISPYTQILDVLSVSHFVYIMSSDLLYNMEHRTQCCMFCLFYETYGFEPFNDTGAGRVSA
jgi:hypothetical protein